MFWDDPGDGRNMQRLKNGIFLKMWVSNDTRDGALPAIGCLTLIAIAGAVIYAMVKA